MHGPAVPYRPDLDPPVRTPPAAMAVFLFSGIVFGVAVTLLLLGVYAKGAMGVGIGAGAAWWGRHLVRTAD